MGPVDVVEGTPARAGEQCYVGGGGEHFFYDLPTRGHQFLDQIITPKSVFIPGPDQHRSRLVPKQMWYTSNATVGAVTCFLSSLQCDELTVSPETRLQSEKFVRATE